MVDYGEDSTFLLDVLSRLQAVEGWLNFSSGFLNVQVTRLQVWTDENVEQFLHVAHMDKWRTISDVCNILCLLYGTFWRILTEDLTFWRRNYFF